MPNRTDVPRPLIALIYNAAAMRRLDPELDLAKRTPGQVDDGELQHLKSYSDVGQHLRQKTQDGSTLPTVASADGHFGADKGSLEEVVESGFANGSSLSDAGVTVDELLELLASDRDEKAVWEEEVFFRKLGVSGVPTYIFNGRFAVSGAQEASVLADAIRQAVKEPAEADDEDA